MYGLLRVIERKMQKLLVFGAVLVVCLLPLSVAAAGFDSDSNTIYWAGCGITKKAFMSELAAAYEKKTHVKIVLEGGGASRGIRDAAALKIDIGGTCRMALPEYNTSEMYSNLHPVAWDALAIIVNPKNKIRNLTIRQVQGIYLGQITNWSQLGGPVADINLYVRRSKISGVGYAIRQYIFQDSGIEFNTPHQLPSSGPIESAVEKDPYGIAITGVSSARKRNVSIVDFDGKTPSYENVKNGTYGLYRPLYLVTGPSPTPRVVEFLSFATSREGRDIIRNNGSVPYHEALSLMTKKVIYGFGVK